MRKALVLGAKGFIGRHVASQLNEEGYEVAGFGHGEWTVEARSIWGVNWWYRSDISYEALAQIDFKPDVIVHAAGGSSVPFSIEHPYQDFLRTVDSTAALLEYARQLKPAVKVVYLSSAGVYGKVDAMPIAETAETHPQSPYGLHKLMAETLCREYACRYGLRVVVLRLFSVYGRGLQKQLLWDASRKCLDGETVFHGTGAETRDWIHVSDAARLVAVLARRQDDGFQIFNGGTGQAVKVAEVLQAIFTRMGANRVPQFNQHVRAGDPAHYCADISLAMALGWTPQVDWKNGVMDYIDWVLDERHCG